MSLITSLVIIASLPLLVSILCLLNLNRLLKKYISGTNSTGEIVKIQCTECKENFDLNDTVLIREEIFIKDFENPEVRVINVRVCHRCITELKLRSLPLGVTMSLFLWLFHPYFERKISEWYFTRKPAPGQKILPEQSPKYEGIQGLDTSIPLT